MEMLTMLFATLFHVPDANIEKKKSKARTKKLMDEKVCSTADEVICKLKEVKKVA